MTNGRLPFPFTCHKVLGAISDAVDRWGFDRQTVREYFSESVTRLVLLDSGIDAGGRQRLLLELRNILALPPQVKSMPAHEAGFLAKSLCQSESG